MGTMILAHSTLVYDILVLRNNTFSFYFHATVQLHNSLGDYAKDLFKISKDVASLVQQNLPNSSPQGD